MSLPNDLVDYILSFLQSDPVTLKKCAQSHPTLDQLSERYIYANITLCDDLDPSKDLRSSEFTRILAKRPDIAKHVRSLTVRVSGNLGLEQDKTRLSHLDSAAFLLPALSGLTKLTIQERPEGWFHFSWQILPETFHQAFLHFIHAQGKKEVSICDVSFFPLSWLNNCKNVRVTLEQCEETQYDRESTKDMLLSYPEPFEHLSVRYCSETCLENTTAWLQTHNLRSLEYKLGRGGVEESRTFLPQALVACSNSLTNLCLDIDHYCTSSVAEPQIRLFKADVHLPVQTSYAISNNSAIYNQNVVRFPFTLTSLRHLEWLTVEANSTPYTITSPSWSCSSPIPAIVELISTASPSFKQIFLKFTYYLFLQTRDPEDLWLPFIPLAAACSSLSITVYLSARVSVYDSKKYAPEKISPAHCGGLIPYIEKGVLVMT